MLASHADIDEDPEDETRAKLIKGFDVKRADGRVEFATDEELGEVL